MTTQATLDALKANADNSAHLTDWIFTDKNRKAHAMLFQAIAGEISPDPNLTISSCAALVLGYAVALQTLGDEAAEAATRDMKKINDGIETFRKVAPVLRRAADLFEKAATSFEANKPAPVATEPDATVNL